MIRLSKSIVGEREIAAVSAIIDQGFLGMGAEVKRFEDDLSAYLNGRDVVCVNTGTSALHLALQAVGINRGDEVLVPTLTYVASFQAISATGAQPISCDVNLSDGLIDLKDAASRVTPNTRAIMPVHFASNPGNLDAVYNFASQHSLRVIEDAAHAFGCSYNNKKIGSFGDIVCFSFDGIKNITSGEGGAIVSSDREVMARIKDARLLGVENDSDKRYRSQRSWDFNVSAQGWRYHMSDLMAAIGRTQLKRFETEFKPQRRKLAAFYYNAFDNISTIKLFRNDNPEIVPHIFPIRILNNRRNEIRQYLEKIGIQTGIHYKPCHLLDYYGGGATKLPAAERLLNEILTLPLHPGLTIDDCEFVAVSLLNILKE